MTRHFLAGLVLLASTSLALAADSDRPIRYTLFGSASAELPTEEYLRFVEQVKPDILITGVFDQRLYATAFPPVDRKAKSPPLPPAELLARWKQVADRLHRNGIRLVGQMELFTVSDRPADREQQAGWFGFHDRGWDDRLLGPRSAKTAAELLEEPDLDRHAPSGTPPVPEADSVARCGCRVNTRALRGCASKPAWRATQKAMVKAALAAGVDGFITNRNYFDHCACEHCTRGFRQWLRNRHSTEELRKVFGIENLEKHPLCIVGAHRLHESTPAPLVLEKHRYARHLVKEFFDEVYTEFGRKLKPDLILAQWNHMACFDELHLDRGHLPPATRTNFSHATADERWGLPAERWGKGESFFWYCHWGTAQNTILAREYAGDSTLYGKYLRAMARGRPYVINKYDFYRPRNMMAEAAALGYLTNAIATHWQTEEDRSVTIRYFDFLKRYEAFYRPAESYAELGLLFPQRALQAGDASPLEYVEAAGRAMIRRHLLFDMIPDELLPGTELAPYRAVVVTVPEYLNPNEKAVLRRYVERGGKLLLASITQEDQHRPGAAATTALRLAKVAKPFDIPALRVENVRTDPDRFSKELLKLTQAQRPLSHFAAPWTVEVHAYRQTQAKRVLLHMVNYNHQEKAAGKSVAAREAPLAADPVAVRLNLPDGFRVQSVCFQSPDEDRTHELPFQEQEGTVTFRTPGFLVYGLCAVRGR